MSKYTKETTQKLDQIAKYIVSQVAYKRKPVSFAEIADACNIKVKFLSNKPSSDKPSVIKAICDTLLQNNRVIDVDVCHFEKEFDVILKPISRCA